MLESVEEKSVSYDRGISKEAQNGEPGSQSIFFDLEVSHLQSEMRPSLRSERHHIVDEHNN